MTTEELLQPRFKVINTYPCSIHKLGDIISTYKSAMSYAVQIDDVSEKICLEDCPHIFKKLEWWEDRKIENLPEYLKDEFDSLVNYYVVVKYYLDSETVDLYDMKIGDTFNEQIRIFKPSTKEQYEANKNI